MAVQVDKSLCNGCGICLFQCGAYVFDFSPQEYRALPARNRHCVNCFACVAKCPQRAIAIRLGGRAL
ncbi:MAG: 4Fe-4S ferredoxin [Chloroflexi bacterium]|nr:4Fe-4S ferredoxin [Chloroflexota bacterium]